MQDFKGKAADILFSLKDKNDATEANVEKAISNFDQMSESFFNSHKDFIHKNQNRS